MHSQARPGIHFDDDASLPFKRPRDVAHHDVETWRKRANVVLVMPPAEG